MIKIQRVNFRQILNSAGKQALEVEIVTDKNILGIASSPSAIVPGDREILVLDNYENEEIENLLKRICNKNIENQTEFDIILSEYIEKLGTNICLPLSLAFARVNAKSENISLVQYISKLAESSKNKKFPIPLVTVFCGGIHNKKEKGSIQNIMISVNIHPFSKAVNAITEIYTYIENEVKEKDLLKGYGASSGMIVQNITTDEKFRMIQNAIQKLNYEKEVSVAIDVAAEHFYNDGKYIYNGKILDSIDLSKILKEYIINYDITYIEDPFNYNNDKCWKMLKKENPNIVIAGDDIFATQEKYISNELANCVIIKMNQVGTLAGTIRAYKKAKSEKMMTCVSHRSIETEDTFMCDLAVALNSDYVKIGGPRRGDRISKYNQLLRLEGIE